MIKIKWPGEAGFGNFLYKLYSKIAMEMLILRRKPSLFAIRWAIQPNNVIQKLIQAVSHEKQIVFCWIHWFSLIFIKDLCKMSLCLHVFLGIRFLHLFRVSTWYLKNLLFNFALILNNVSMNKQIQMNL